MALARFMNEKGFCSWLTLSKESQEAYAREFVERIKNSDGFIETYLQKITESKAAALSLRGDVKLARYTKPEINYVLKEEGYVIRAGKRIPLVKLVIIGALGAGSLKASEDEHANSVQTTVNLVGDVVLPISPRDAKAALNFASSGIKETLENTPLLQSAKSSFAKERSDQAEIETELK